MLVAGINMERPTSSDTENGVSTHHDNPLSSSDPTRPFIGFFWDIENCPIPRGKPVANIADHLRRQFVAPFHREELVFVCVCDTSKETTENAQEMVYASITMIHIPNGCKNAADDKIRMLMRQFVGERKRGDVLVLISGDINFSPELREARYARGLHVIVLHPERTNDSLLILAHEHYSWEDQMTNVETKRRVRNNSSNPYNNMIIVSNLPIHKSPEEILQRVRQLVSITGGRVDPPDMRRRMVNVYFPNPDCTRRAKFKLNGENVYGTKIVTSYHPSSDLRSAEQRLDDASEPGQEPSYPGDHLRSGSTTQKYMHPSRSFPSNLMGMTSTPYSHVAPVSFRPPVLQYHNLDRYHQNSTFPAVPSAPELNGYGYPDMLPPSQPAPMGSLRSVRFVAPRFPGDSVEQPVVPSYPTSHGAPYVSEKPLPSSAEASVVSAGATPEEGTFFQRHLPAKRVEDVIKIDAGAAVSSPAPVNMPSKSAQSPSYFQTFLLKNQLKQQKGAKKAASPTKTNSFTKTSEGLLDSFAKKDGAAEPSKISPPLLHGAKVRSLSADSSSKLTTSLHKPDRPAEEEEEQKVDLYICNLDRAVDRDEMYLHLLEALEEYVPIQHISTYDDQQGIAYAHVVVPRACFADELIRRFDGIAFFNRTLTVTLEHPDLPLPDFVKLAVVTIFRSVGKMQMPLMDLIRAFEIEYDQILDLRMLRRMTDMLKESEENGARIISLLETAYNWEREQKLEGLISLPNGYCTKHISGDEWKKNHVKKGYDPLRCYRVSLIEFETHLKQLLGKHQGNMPIKSFLFCYEALFGRLIEDATGGAYLGHLLCSVPGVKIEQKPYQPSKLCLSDTTDAPNSEICGGEAVAKEMGQRIWDLLALQPRAALPVNAFLDAYHKQTGVDCPSKSFDRTRALRYVQSVSEDIEIIGVGAERLVTLTHKAQKCRFILDISIIRNVCKPAVITKDNLPELYMRVFGRFFTPTDYGAAFVDDLFPDDQTAESRGEPVPVAAAGSSSCGPAQPLKGRQKKECSEGSASKAVKALGVEFSTLLSTSPQYRQEFLKFPGVYAQIFKRPLVLRTYGFLKLVDLIEALPDVAEVVVVQRKNRYIRLCLARRIEHLKGFLAELPWKKEGYTVVELKDAFMKKCRMELRPKEYNIDGFERLLNLFGEVVKVVKVDGTLTIHTREKARNISGSSMDADRSASSEDEQKLAAAWQVGSTGSETDRQEVERETVVPATNLLSPCKQEITAAPSNVVKINGDQPTMSAKPAVFARLAMSFG